MIDSNNYQAALEEQIIGTTPICIFENHAHALLPWARWKTKFNQPLVLLSLDHHSDTNSCYLRSLFQQVGRDLDTMEELRNQRLNATDYTKEQDIIQALDGLYHDEHIHAALRLGIIDAAYIIQHSFKNIDHSLAEKGMYVAPTEVDPHKDSKKVCQDSFEQVLETNFLDRQLNTFQQITPSFNYKTAPYILDIDLDVFKSLKSAQPNDATTFKKIIQHAKGITIARESEWIRRLKTESELNSDQLQDIVLNHIKNAIG